MRRLSFLAAFIVAACLVSVTAWAQYLGTSSVSGGGSGMSADAIMDAVQTVDGPASQLDADFLDGISSQGFAQTFTMTTGITCAAGGGVSTLTLDPVCPDAGGIVIVNVTNSDADGCVVTLSETSADLGCTAIVTLVSSAGGAVTFADVSNVANLSSTWSPAVGEMLILGYQDLSNDQWQEEARTLVDSNNDMKLTADGNDFLFGNTSSGTVALMTLVSSITQLRANSSTGTILQLGTGGGTAHLGTRDNRAASAFVTCTTDDLDGSGGLLDCTYGSGLKGTLTPQTCDCGTAGTPNTVTCDVQASVVYLIDGDADACTVTLSETTASAIGVDLGPVRIVVTNLGGGGAFTVADSAGVIELAGGTSFSGGSLGDTLTVHYVVGGSTDAWYEMGRADN